MSELKIGSMEFITMNRESIFDEPFIEDEIYGITQDKDEWMAYHKNKHKNQNVTTEQILFIEGNEIVEQFINNVPWYMTERCAKLGTETIISSMRRFNNLDELSEIDPTKIALYDITERQPGGERYYIRFSYINE